MGLMAEPAGQNLVAGQMTHVTCDVWLEEEEAVPAGQGDCGAPPPGQ